MKGAAAGGLRAILREPAYRRYVLGNGVSLVGTWVQRTGIGWLAWQLEQSAGWLGAVAFASLFPSVVAGLAGGVVADRFDRRRVLLVAQSLLAVQALLLGLFTAAGRIDIRGLVVLAALQGLVIAFNQPARLALVPSLVRPHQLAAAVAFNSVLFNSARFVGPALAGLLIAGLGTAATFFFNAASFLAFILALATLPPLPVDDPPARQGSALAALVEGLQVVRTTPVLLATIALVALSAVLVRPVGEFLPAVAATLLGGGPGTLAALSSALGLGAIGGGLWLAAKPPRDALHATLLLSGATVPAVCLLAASRGPTLALVAAALCGATLAGSGVAAQTLVQMRAPPALRGRVVALFGLGIRGLPALGAIGIGLAADQLGLPVALIVAASLFALAPLLVGLRRRGRRTVHAKSTYWG